MECLNKTPGARRRGWRTGSLNGLRLGYQSRVGCDSVRFGKALDGLRRAGSCVTIDQQLEHQAVAERNDQKVSGLRPVGGSMPRS